MKTAEKIKNLKDFNGQAALYKLSEPLEGNTYVIVSAVTAYSGLETYIFPASDDGKVIDWRELEGSFRGDLNHSEALEGAGYKVAA